MSNNRVLNVVVIGGGIGGLSAALCLALHGHSVHVFEAEAELSELGAGIQVTPNAARILDRWGLRDSLEQKATKPAQESIRRYSDGTLKARGRSHTKEAFGYDIMVIHRADFQNLLYQAAIEHGARVSFGKKVTYDDISAADASRDPTIANADLIVASDGISSKMRYGLHGYEATKPALTGDTATRIILERQKLLADPKLAHLVKEPTSTIWMGPRRHVVAYTIRNMELFNVVLCGPGEAPVGVYNEPCDPKGVAEEYSDFEEVVRGIISTADTAHRWTISETPPLPSWSSEDGRLVLLGDAAHAMMPYTASGAAQCIEDAVVLGACLSRAQPGQDLSKLLKIYETLRKPRAQRVQEVAKGNRFFWGMEDGSEQEARDERLAESLTPNTQGKDNAGPKERPKADAQAPFLSPEFSEWLYGFDAEKEAFETLEQARST